MGINFHQLSDEDIREKYKLAGYSIPANHNRIKEIFMVDYEKCATLTKEKIEKLLQKDQIFAVSIDESTNIVSKRFMSVILHMNNGIVNLALPRIIGTSPAQQCAEILHQKLGEFGLNQTQHIFSVSSDGAPVMVKCESQIEENIDSVLSNGLFHIQCANHALHLVVMDIFYETSCNFEEFSNDEDIEREGDFETGNPPALLPEFEKLIDLVRKYVKKFKKAL